MSPVSVESFISSQVFIIILVMINLFVNAWYTVTTLRIRKKENEDIENRHREDKEAAEKRYKEELEATNLRHEQMLNEQRLQFTQQLDQMKDHQAKELEVKVIVESQKERIEDIRELSNTFLSEIAVLKRIVNQNMQTKYRKKSYYDENFSQINEEYYEALEKLQEKRTSLDFRLSELDNSELLKDKVDALFMKTIRSPKMIKDMEDYNYISQYNDNHNQEKSAFINEASKYLKEEWKDLYNRIDQLSNV